MDLAAARFLEPFATPLAAGCFLLLLALFLSWGRRGASRLCTLLALSLLVGMGMWPVAERLAAPLESSYPVPPPDARAQAAVVLGGALDLERSTPERLEFNEQPERIIEGVRLVREGRARWLVISGGSGDPRYPNASEARLLEVFAREFGVQPSAVILEPESRNTHEDALYTARILRERGIGQFFLVTSAYHMLRAAACFRKAGLAPIPYPVDFRALSPDEAPPTYAPSAQALGVATLALREYAGYGVYWALGYL
jgi:uncharacterized SAM-binding protein YcdF (DUF218 family)